MAKNMCNGGCCMRVMICGRKSGKVDNKIDDFVLWENVSPLQFSMDFFIKIY